MRKALEQAAPSFFLRRFLSSSKKALGFCSSQETSLLSLPAVELPFLFFSMSYPTRYLLPRTKRGSSYTETCSLGAETCQISNSRGNAWQNGAGFALQIQEKETRALPGNTSLHLCSVSSPPEARPFSLHLGHGILAMGTLLRT